MITPHTIKPSDAISVLNQITDGVYVTDTERRIIFWNDAAERITGYTREEVLGRNCSDNLLCHVDRNDNLLCGKSRCPLHRSIVTGNKSDAPMTVYAKHKNGHRVPTQVTVSPLINEAGETVGGVEVFRDVTSWIKDLERAKRIQGATLGEIESPDKRLEISIQYAPQDLIGGDFYAAHSVDTNTFAFFLADVMGHGVSASLYTMYLRSLWSDHRHLAGDPGDCLLRMNTNLSQLIGEDYGFATVVLVSIDLSTGRARIAGGGHPSPLLFRHEGGLQEISCQGYPLGLMEDADFKETSLQLAPRDRLLLYTDGAIEGRDDSGEELGTEGLIRMLRECGYPTRHPSLEHLEELILKSTSNIVLEDDLTLIEMVYRPKT
ncbi:MAG: SpoIIE family protein phosphatase [Candidatus Sumerlaeia bacterium]|nr:SpoIIE family protein phosphatase [Candidatus Sumerlaeia bacterium]